MTSKLEVPSWCGETKHVQVVNGLFNTSQEGCTPENIYGQQLYLGIEVESGGEMTSRQNQSRCTMKTRKNINRGSTQKYT